MMLAMSDDAACCRVSTFIWTAAIIAMSVNWSMACCRWYRWTKPMVPTAAVPSATMMTTAKAAWSLERSVSSLNP